VSKSYDGGRTRAVDEVSFAAAAGELIVFLGESGCGKTTTLKMINRLIEASSGRILVDGADVTARDPVELRRSIGYVFQGIGLFPHLTVARNIGIVPSLEGWDGVRIERRVDELLELVRLEPAHRERMPAELSGGQQQRVGFARALAARPSLMLLDEPFGALDPITRTELQGELSRIQRQLGLTAVLVTHDVTEALLLGDRIIVMRRGRVVADGSPREFLSEPGDPYVERLMATPKRQAERLEHLAGRAEDRHDGPAG
jgi:osmoprotectant transport system ATP-binding protein